VNAPLRRNRTIGEQYHDALLEAGEAKRRALLAKKRMDRMLDVALLNAEGKSADQRKSSARLNQKYMEAEDAWYVSEAEHVTAKTKADALCVLWESWRTEQANARAEMKMV
jgi:hypothetical protein